MGTNEMGDQWDGGPMSRGNQWDGGPMKWVMHGCHLGDQWDGGPMRWGTNEMGDQWDGGPMRWGTNDVHPSSIALDSVFHTAACISWINDFWFLMNTYQANFNDWWLRDLLWCNQDCTVGMSTLALVMAWQHAITCADVAQHLCRHMAPLLITFEWRGKYKSSQYHGNKFTHRKDMFCFNHTSAFYTWNNIMNSYCFENEQGAQALTVNMRHLIVTIPGKVCYSRNPL